MSAVLQSSEWGSHFPPELVLAYSKAIKDHFQEIKQAVITHFWEINTELWGQEITTETEGEDYQFYGWYHFTKDQVTFLKKHLDVRNKRIVIPIDSHAREVIHQKVADAQQKARTLHRNISEELLNQELSKYADEIGFLSDHNAKFLSIDVSDFLDSLRSWMELGLWRLLNVSMRKYLIQLHQKALTIREKQKSQIENLWDVSEETAYTQLEESLLGDTIPVVYVDNDKVYIILKLTWVPLVISNPQTESLTTVIFDESVQYDLKQVNGLPWLSHWRFDSLLSYYLWDLDPKSDDYMHIWNIKLANPLNVIGENTEFSLRESIFPMTEIARFIENYLKNIYLAWNSGWIWLPLKFIDAAELPLIPSAGHGIPALCRFEVLDTRDHAEIVRVYELELAKRSTRERVWGLVWNSTTSVRNFFWGMIAALSWK